MENKAGEVKGLSIVRAVSCVGPRKVGLDSCVLYDLIVNPLVFSREHAKIFEVNDVMFTHRICLSEVKDKLIEKQGYTEKDAKEEVLRYLKEHNIGIVERDFANQQILNELYEKCRRVKIDIHIPDSWIIADFKKNGINKVYSTNRHFREACKVLGIDGAPFPTYDRALDNQIRNALGVRKTKNHNK